MCRLIFIFIALWVTSPSSYGRAERRAFVAANQNYLPALLGTANSLQDAKIFAELVTGMGFKVHQKDGVLDTSRKDFLDSWKGFLKTISPGDQVVVYYSGHGSEAGGKNYIVPKVTADELRLSENDADAAFVSIPDELVASLNAKRPGSVVWIFDACRSEEGRVKGVSARPESGSAFFLYSSDSRQTSQGFKGDKLSIFTRELIYTMKMYPDLPLNIVAKIIQRRVRNRIIAKNVELKEKYRQNPAFYDSLSTPWCFLDCLPGQLIEINYFSGRYPVNETDILSFKKALPVDDWKRNAVFVGRDSSAAACDDRDEKKYDSHPFGCRLLQEFSNGSIATKLGASIVAKTPVNVRERMPLPRFSGQDRGCTVRTASSGDVLRLTGTLEIVYAGDIFYWATIDTQEGCKPAVAASLSKM